MTEPEDLEEDLFADLYDADDSTHHAAPPAAVPNLPEPPPKPGQINQPTSPHPPSNFDSDQITRVDPLAEQQFPQNREQRNGIQSDAMPDGESAATNVEPETQGTGIKEDG